MAAANDRAAPRNASAANFVLRAPSGAVRALSGIDAASLRAALDEVEPVPDGRRVLFATLPPAANARAIADGVIAILARTALHLWPIWYGDKLFPERDDALGRLGGAIVAREAAVGVPGASANWAEAAARLALRGRPPRVAGAPAAVEVEQLALAVAPGGLVFVADAAGHVGHPGAFVHALEWIARHIPGAVVALFVAPPPFAPPFDRLLYGALDLATPIEIPPAPETSEIEAWIAPWRGRPHPASEIEQRLAAALGADAELGPLFEFNQCVVTARGTRPKVDLVWLEGRLAVELDGWGSHGNRLAFAQDRHRDYELIVSGFTVLRLTNDEIALDMEKALEKIRDVVALRRRRAASEA